MNADAQIVDALYEGYERSGVWLADRTLLSVAALYPALVRLENEGKVTSRWLDGPKPRTRVYRLSVSADGDA